MKKIGLEIVGLTYSHNHQGAYNLVMEETSGKRRLPIVIGSFEAQAIAIELEKMTPSRPLTHDLVKSLALGFNIVVEEVIIHNLIEGIFHSKLICSNKDKKIEIDARTSDAIAVAVRFGCPVTTYESILAKAGITVDDEALSSENEIQDEGDLLDLNQNSILTKSTEELKQLLNEALEEEDYEKASQIRDELNNRKKS